MSNFTKETTANSRIIVLDESGYDGSWAESEEGKKRLAENKQEIVDEVIKEVSKKIINQKAIKDFKKGLE